MKFNIKWKSNELMFNIYIYIFFVICLCIHEKKSEVMDTVHASLLHPYVPQTNLLHIQGHTTCYRTV